MPVRLCNGNTVTRLVGSQSADHDVASHGPSHGLRASFDGRYVDWF